MSLSARTISPRNRLLRLTLPAGLALLAASAASTPAFAQCSFTAPVTWTAGASGLWGTGANWSGGSYPNSATTNACIADNISTVTLNVNATVENLQVSEPSPAAPNTLTISPGTQLTVAGAEIFDQGNINIGAGSGQNAVLAISNNVRIFQAGAITLSSGAGGGTAYIRGAGQTLTVSEDFTIQGAGVIGDDGMNFVIEGPSQNAPGVGGLLANVPGGVLDIGSGGGAFQNSSTVSVLAGSTLKVTADSKGFDQTGGTTLVNGNLIVPHGFNNEYVTPQLGTLQGFLFGDGTITGNVNNDNVIMAGSGATNFPPLPGGSVLSITGNLTEGSNSSLRVDTLLPGSPGYSQLHIGGDAVLAGNLDAGDPNSGIPFGTYRILDFGASSGDFTSASFEGNACSAAGADLWRCGGNFYMQERFVTGGLDLSIRGVPEPASWAMLLVGLVGLGGIMRMQRKRSAVAQG